MEERKAKKREEREKGRNKEESGWKTKSRWQRGEKNNKVYLHGKTNLHLLCANSDLRISVFSLSFSSPFSYFRATLAPVFTKYTRSRTLHAADDADYYPRK